MAPSARFTEDFAYEVLSVVGEIPEGTVATYGQIARLAGMPRCARLVGYAMAARTSSLRRVPLPPRRKSRRPPRPRLAGTGFSAAAGRRGAERRDACGPQEISMGMLI